MNVGELFVRLGLDSDNFRRGLSNTENQVRGFGSSVGAVTTAVKGLLAGAGVAAGWKWLVDGNAQMEQYEQTLRIVLGSQEEAVRQLKWAQNFAAKTPFEIPDIVEATTRLSAYGITAKDVLGDVGDMAAAMGKPLMQAVEAIADAQTGELERLKEFGITKQMLIDKAAEMGKAEIVNAKGQITDMEGLNEALIAIIKERYSGAMEAQSTTLNGMISNLKDWLGTAGRTLGEGVFDQVKGKLGELLAYLNQLSESGQLQVWADNISKIMLALITVLGFVVNNVDTLIPLLAGLAARFVALQVIGMVTGLVTAYRSSLFLTTVAQQGLNAAMRANPIGTVITLIGLLVAAGVALYKNWDNISKWLTKTWEGIGKTADKVWSGIKSSLAKTWEDIEETASKIWDSIKDFFEENGKTILLLAIGPAGWAILLGTKLAENWNKIKNTATNVWSSIKGTLQSIWSNIVSASANSVTNLYNTTKSKMESLWSYIRSIPSRAYNWGKDIIRRLADGFRSVHIPTPHFDFSVRHKSIAGLSVPYPDIDVDWYDKGGIFTNPSIIGVGEKRPEFVGALDDLRKIVREESGAGNNGQPIQINLTLDGRVISQHLFYLQRGTLRGQGR